MATVTVLFPWTPSLSLTAKLIKITDDSITFSSATCVEKTNAKGIYSATFTNPSAGDYFILPLLSGVPVEGNGTIFGLTNTATTFYETSLSTPGTVVLSPSDIDDIASGVVIAIQDIPGFAVEVVSPADVNGDIVIRQGDSYLDVDSRAIQVSLTGVLPTLAETCVLRVMFGGSVIEIEGTVVVVDSTHYTLKFDITGAVSESMPAGLFNYEVEVTYAGTENRWTPSTGSFTVNSQIPGTN